MAARATRSTSRAAASRCRFLELSHDELDVIFDGLADPLQPVVAVALSSTCLGLRTPLLAALGVLKERHARAVALCRKESWLCAARSCAELRSAEIFRNRGLDADDMATLGMLLKWLPRLQELNLDHNYFEDAGMEALCEKLGPGSCPSLRTLSRVCVDFGPAGAEALAAALRRGALPNLEYVWLLNNPIGAEGVAALAVPLRKLPALKYVRLDNCEIGSEGVASLMDNLGKDDFKTLECFYLEHNGMSNEACAKIVSLIDSGKMPSFVRVTLEDFTTTTQAVQALARRRAPHAS